MKLVIATRRCKFLLTSSQMLNTKLGYFDTPLKNLINHIYIFEISTNISHLSKKTKEEENSQHTKLTKYLG